MPNLQLVGRLEDAGLEPDQRLFRCSLQVAVGVADLADGLALEIRQEDPFARRGERTPK